MNPRRHAPNPLTKPPDCGVYLLMAYLERPSTIRVGKLGTFCFPKGYYVYVGSAMQGLEKRLARHVRRQKKTFWHIDYLLRRARVVETKKYLTSRRRECFLSALFSRRKEADIVVKKFGASDCCCPTHLWFFRFNPRTVLSSISATMKEELE